MIFPAPQPILTNNLTSGAVSQPPTSENTLVASEEAGEQTLASDGFAQRLVASEAQVKTYSTQSSKALGQGDLTAITRPSPSDIAIPSAPSTPDETLAPTGAQSLALSLQPIGEQAEGPQATGKVLPQAGDLLPPASPREETSDKAGAGAQNETRPVARSALKDQSLPKFASDAIAGTVDQRILEASDALSGTVRVPDTLPRSGQASLDASALLSSSELSKLGSAALFTAPTSAEQAGEAAPASTEFRATISKPSLGMGDPDIAVLTVRAALSDALPEAGEQPTSKLPLAPSGAKTPTPETSVPKRIAASPVSTPSEGPAAFGLVDPQSPITPEALTEGPYERVEARTPLTPDPAPSEARFALGDEISEAPLAKPSATATRTPSAVFDEPRLAAEHPGQEAVKADPTRAGEVGLALPAAVARARSQERLEVEAVPRAVQTRTPIDGEAAPSAWTLGSVVAGKPAVAASPVPSAVVSASQSAAIAESSALATTARAGGLEAAPVLPAPTGYPAVQSDAEPLPAKQTAAPARQPAASSDGVLPPTPQTSAGLPAGPAILASATAEPVNPATLAPPVLAGQVKAETIPAFDEQRVQPSLTAVSSAVASTRDIAADKRPALVATPVRASSPEISAPTGTSGETKASAKADLANGALNNSPTALATLPAPTRVQSGATAPSALAASLTAAVEAQAGTVAPSSQSAKTLALATAPDKAKYNALAPVGVAPASAVPSPALPSVPLAQPEPALSSAPIAEPAPGPIATLSASAQPTAPVSVSLIASAPAALNVAQTAATAASVTNPGAATAAILEQVTSQVAEAREAGRGLRPELTLRHADFGTVAMRIEPGVSGAVNDWRATLSARDPGFVPAVQAALLERGVAAASESGFAQSGFSQNSGSQAGSQGASSQRGGDQNSQSGAFQNSAGFGAAGGGSDQRYGSSTGGSQGSAQPYSGEESDGGSNQAAAVSGDSSGSPVGDAQGGAVFA
mgnify:CR=1 FL=1